MKTLKEAPYNLTDDGDGSKSNFDDLSPKIIEAGVNLLKQNNFKFPDNLAFEQKVKDVYNFQLSQYSNSIIALRGDDMFPEVVIRKHHYILIQDADSDTEELINRDELFQYNNYIFYNSKTAYEFLKLKFPEVLQNLVLKFGYNKDKVLMNWFLSEFNYSDKDQFFELIFSFDPHENKYIIREQILDDITNILYDGKIKGFDEVKTSKKDCYQNLENILIRINENKNKIKNPNKSIAILLNSNLSVGEIGNTELWLNDHRDFFDLLKKENFYELEYLKEFTNNIYQNTTSQDNYFVQDPDGYTNLRKDRNTSSEILQKVKSGDEVEVLNNSGDWWQVKTKEGKEGFIHKSRLVSAQNYVGRITIYARPDFNSFPREIETKGGVEYIHTILGWDFVKTNGSVGYMPTEEAIQEQVLAQKEKRKHSFWVDDDEYIEPRKKKGFWGRLFG